MLMLAGAAANANVERSSVGHQLPLCLLDARSNDNGAGRMET
jgi:hypothetical protein